MTDEEFCAEARRQLLEQVKRLFDGPDWAILQLRNQMNAIDLSLNGPKPVDVQLERLVHLLAWITLERVH